MAVIIMLETSGRLCSAAVEKDGDILLSRTSAEEHAHAANLPLFLQEALDLLKERGEKPDAVAVSGGPGSYTGLRIGVSCAKGVCYALGIPLIAVDTLELIALTAAERIAPSADTLICPMIDARRMEVYTATFDSTLAPVAAARPEIIDGGSFSGTLSAHKVLFCGSGADKCREVIAHPNALFVSGIEPEAQRMASIAERMFSGRQFADTAYYEPNYLKEFQTTTQKKNIITQ